MKLKILTFEIVTFSIWTYSFFGLFHLHIQKYNWDSHSMTFNANGLLKKKWHPLPHIVLSLIFFFYTKLKYKTDHTVFTYMQVQSFFRSTAKYVEYYHYYIHCNIKRACLTHTLTHSDRIHVSVYFFRENSSKDFNWTMIRKDRSQHKLHNGIGNRQAATDCQYIFGVCTVPVHTWKHSTTVCARKLAQVLLP